MLPEYFYLDPIQWLLFIASVFAFVIYISNLSNSLFSQKTSRFMYLSFLVLSFLTIIRYVMIIVFNYSGKIVSGIEADIIHEFSRITDVYVMSVVLIMGIRRFILGRTIIKKIKKELENENRHS